MRGWCVYFATAERAKQHLARGRHGDSFQRIGRAAEFAGIARTGDQIVHRLSFARVGPGIGWARLRCKEKGRLAAAFALVIRQDQAGMLPAS
jgi:hypothetical protein